MFRLENEEALSLLLDRVKNWEKDPRIISLYEKMYESYLWEGVFDGKDYSISEVVDNDCVNNCFTVSEGEEDFENVLKVYKEQGLGDCSCEDCEGSFIEAVDDEENPTIFLLRW